MSETQSIQDRSRSNFSRVSVQIVKSLINTIEGIHNFLLQFLCRLDRLAILPPLEFLRIVHHRRHQRVEFLRPRFQLQTLVIHAHHRLQRCHRGARLDLFLQEEDINRVGNRNGSRSQRLQEGTLPTPVSPDESVPISVIQYDFGLFEEDGAHVLEGDVGDVDIAGSSVYALAVGGVGYEGAFGGEFVGGFVVDSVVAGAFVGVGSIACVVGIVQDLHFRRHVFDGIVVSSSSSSFFTLLFGRLFGVPFLFCEGLLLFFGQFLFEELVVAFAHGRIACKDGRIHFLILASLEFFFCSEFGGGGLLLRPSGSHVYLQ
mmetsp:Transcript_15712/g.28228  ORF Transcript_15712/g.28228 Transcript_15712/m.28228 type:complete len:316 (-) Transcript_15712:53-1000(-)